MIAYLFLLGAICCSAFLSITATVFNKMNKTGKNFSGLYNLIVTISSFAVWTVVYLKDASFSPLVLLYSFVFGIFYVSAFIGLFKAMGFGSASLTSFIKQLSLILVALWGLAFWNNPISVTVSVGIALVLVSLWFCFKPSRTDKTSVKWFIFSAVLLIGNAGCSIVQKYQQIHFNGEHGGLLMFGATASSVLFCIILYLRGERPKISDMPRFSLPLPIIAGVSSAMLNVFVLRLIASPLSESVFFPIIGVGGITLTTLFSVGVYKERLTVSKWIGLVIGIVAIVFLNI